MTHQRTIIRKAAVAQLTAALAGTGVQVYDTRHTPVRRNALPAVCVFAQDEEVDEDSKESAPREFGRKLNLQIDCISDSKPDDLADALDDICELVEDAIAVDETLGAQCADTYPKGTKITFENDGEQVLGNASMTFVVEYWTNLPKTTDGLDDFDKAHTNFSLSNEQALTEQAKDIVENIHGDG